MKRYALRNKTTNEWYCKRPKYYSSTRWTDDLKKARLYKRMSDIRCSIGYVTSGYRRVSIESLEIVEFEMLLNRTQILPSVKPKPTNHWDPVISREVL